MQYDMPYRHCKTRMTPLAGSFVYLMCSVWPSKLLTTIPTTPELLRNKIMRLDCAAYSTAGSSLIQRDLVTCSVCRSLHGTKCNVERLQYMQSVSM